MHRSTSKKGAHGPWHIANYPCELLHGMLRKGTLKPCTETQVKKVPMAHGPFANYPCELLHGLLRKGTLKPCTETQVKKVPMDHGPLPTILENCFMRCSVKEPKAMHRNSSKKAVENM